MRILIFGDSITQGMWDSKGGWVQRLIDDAFSVQMQNLDIDMPILFNLGISADQTTHLLQRLYAETKARLRPGEMAFVFAIGVNDSWINADGSFAMSAQEYRANLEQLFAKARVHSDKILFVGLSAVDEARTTPVSWIDIDYTNERIELFDKTLQQVCAAKSVAFVPVFDKFQKRQQQTNLLLDGLHPNDEGHELIYGLVKPELKKLIG